MLSHDPIAQGTPDVREAVFYLGEALRLGGSPEAAKGYYELLATEIDEPFGRDAAVRLIEVASAMGLDDVVDRAWERFVESAGDQAIEPTVAYALGKSYWRRKLSSKADAVFARIPQDAPRGRQAMYFRGVIRLQAGDRVGAEQVFTELSVLPAAEGDRKTIRDQALLALARLRYERGSFRDAAGVYARIEDGTLRADALFEKAWAELRGGRARFAVDDLDLFLLAFPDHARVPEVKLLRANALLKLEQDTESHEAYKGFAAEYGPVAQRLASLLTQGDPERFLSAIGAKAGEQGVARALPKAAAAEAVANPQVKRAVSLSSEVGGEKSSLADGRALASLVSEGIEAASVAGLPEANDRRRRVWELELRAQRARLAVLSEGDPALVARANAALAEVPRAREAHARTNAERRSKIEDVRARAMRSREAIDSARAQAVALEKYLRDSAEGGVPDEKLQAAGAAIRAEIKAAEDRYREIAGLLRELKTREAATRSPQLSPAEVQARADLDAALGALEARAIPAPEVARLANVRKDLAVTLDVIARVEKDRIAGAKRVLVVESGLLAGADAELGRVEDSAERVAAASAKRGIREVRQTFEALLLRADLGALDVAWTRKERESEKIRDLEEQRDRAIDALEKRFQPLLQPEAEGRGWGPGGEAPGNQEVQP